MKNIIKQTLIAAVLLAAVPAFAGQGPTKGTKSYQSAARSERPTQPQTQANTAEPKTAEEAAQMAPAAGETMDMQAPATQGKTMREQMKLPRKN